MILCIIYRNIYIYTYEKVCKKIIFLYLRLIQTYLHRNLYSKKNHILNIPTTFAHLLTANSVNNNKPTRVLNFFSTIFSKNL